MYSDQPGHIKAQEFCRICGKSTTSKCVSWISLQSNPGLRGFVSNGNLEGGLVRSNGLYVEWCLAGIAFGLLRQHRNIRHWWIFGLLVLPKILMGNLIATATSSADSLMVPTMKIAGGRL